MDGRNIYELCDYNVPYEIGVKEGINRGMLVPFHYYGIYDDTDYSSLHLVKGHYDGKELNETYIGNVHRHDLIYKYYCKYGSKQALGFCCTREHAEEMAKKFSKRGIPAVAVYSNSNGEYAIDRQEAIESLKRGEIRVIFSVDMFNEGVDITSVDMVMFLRPTDSPVVFMQQLGRGLRKCKGKKYLNVLDFIGNYHKAGRIRYLLTGRKSSAGQFNYAQQDDYPDGCLIDFDMRLIDLFAEMDKKLVKLREQIYHEYCRIKDMLGERPSRVDLFTYMDEDVYQKAVAHAKDNPFKNYLGFLKEHKELNEEETALCNGIGYEFVKLIENTNMTKVYKMPVLQAIYNDGDIRMEVTDEEIVDCWKSFFDANENWRDFDSDMTYEKYRNIMDKAHLKKIMQMSVKLSFH
ncbi:helicase-related protein [uncultured Eubacterium sp.]|uniref:DEAD/DEAH box helicase n=1 Tax=uncultured Eubacterium sp. TaxID=165185 RepID=UPI00338E461A